MAKTVHDSCQDAMLNKIGTSTRLTVCKGTAAPSALTDLATDGTGSGLASVTMTALGATGTDYTVGVGDGATGSEGRKITVAAQADLPIDQSGDATHIALDDGTNILYVTTCTTQSLTAGGTVDVPSWAVNVADPA